MAFPEILNVQDTISNTPATSHGVDMPATVNAGDMLLAVMYCSDVFLEEQPSVTPPANWRILYRRIFGGLIIVAKKADGTEGGTSPTFTLGDSRKLIARVHRITGWRDFNFATLAVETGLAIHQPNPSVVIGLHDLDEVGFFNNTPDPPLTDLAEPDWSEEGVSGLPVSGAVEVLWIAVFNDGRDEFGATVTEVTSYPENYINGAFLAEGITEFENPQIGIAYRERESTSEDPGVFTLNVTGGWGAMTLAIMPAQAVPDLEVELSETVNITEVLAEFALPGLTENIGVEDVVSILILTVLNEPLGVSEALAIYVNSILDEEFTVDEFVLIAEILSESLTPEESLSFYVTQDIKPETVRIGERMEVSTSGEEGEIGPGPLWEAEDFDVVQEVVEPEES